MVTIITLNTVLTCQVPLDCAASDAIYVICGTDVPVGCMLMYSYNATDGCSYSVYDHDDACIADCTFSSISDSVVRGGGFTIDANMAYIKFSANVTLCRTIDLTVADIISNVTDVVTLRRKLESYKVDEQYRQDIVDIYLDSNSSSSAVVRYHRGAIYLSTIEINPVELLGGAWQKLTGVFPASVFAWSYMGNSTSAICGTFLCGEAVAGQ